MNKLCFLIVLTLALLTACTVTPQSTVTTTEVATTTVPAISTTTVTISTTVFPIRIRVATDATWPPFEYFDTDTNEIVGFDIDLFNAIAKKAGLEVEWVNIEWDLLLAGATQGTYDAAISSITIREDLKDSMDFSDPYYVAGQIIVTRSYSTITGAGDLAGKRVGVQSGTTGDDEVRAIDGVNVVGYDDIGMALTALMNYQVDAVVCDTPVGCRICWQV
jgi:polar amino acid transport system substrate-binding protein